jgi:hypothetical protein
VDYSILTGLGKALKSAAVSVLALALASGGVDVFFNSFATSIAGLHLPVAMVPVLIAGIRLLQNYLKQKFEHPAVQALL